MFNLTLQTKLLIKCSSMTTIFRIIEIVSHRIPVQSYRPALTASVVRNCSQPIPKMNRSRVLSAIPSRLQSNPVRQCRNSTVSLVRHLHHQTQSPFEEVIIACVTASVRHRAQLAVPPGAFTGVQTRGPGSSARAVVIALAVMVAVGMVRKKNNNSVQKSRDLYFWCPNYPME